MLPAASAIRSEPPANPVEYEATVDAVPPSSGTLITSCTHAQ